MSLPVPFPNTGLIQLKTNIGYRRDLWTPAAFDYDVFEDKFWGDALNGFYPSAKTNGTAAAVTFAEHNANGYISIISGTDNDGYAGQGLGNQFTGDRGILAQFIVQTPATVTAFKMEVGLSDADDDAGAINVKATPTFTATDCAVFVVDTDDDANIGFISAMAGAGVATQDIQAIAASTTYRFAIRVEGNSVSAWINGKQVAGHAAGIEGGSKLTPWIFSQSRIITSSRDVLLYKWQVIQPAY